MYREKWVFEYIKHTVQMFFYIVSDTLDSFYFISFLVIVFLSEGLVFLELYFYIYGNLLRYRIFL